MNFGYTNSYGANNARDDVRVKDDALW